MATGKYDNVMNYFGESVQHYGKKDAPTYFAEACFQKLLRRPIEEAVQSIILKTQLSALKPT